MSIEQATNATENQATDAIGTEKAGYEGQYLTFIMDNEEYGVDIMKVMEIRGWEQPTIIPQAPTYVKGVINIRGTIVPIIDLRQRFSLDAKEYSKITVVIVVQVNTIAGEQVIGIVVDAVSEVYNFTNEMIKASPDIIHDKDADFIKGLATANDKMIIILDVEQLMDAEDVQGLTDTVNKMKSEAA